jgi:hypothetical protein
MKHKYLLFVFIICANGAIGQKNSFFYNLEFSIKPIVYALNNWNVNYTIYDTTSYDIYNPLENWENSKVKFIDPVKLRNYITQEFDVKVYFNIYKNFKIGLGSNFKMRKLEYDIYFRPFGNSPRNYTTIWALHYFAKYNYLGYNLNFRWNIPKLKSNISFFWEMNETFNKDNREPELSVLYDYSYLLVVKTRHATPKSLVFSPYVGIDVNTKLIKNLNFNFHLAYKYVADYDSRFGLYFINSQNEPSTIFEGGILSNGLVIGAGLTYQFYK